MAPGAQKARQGFATLRVYEGVVVHDSLKPLAGCSDAVSLRCAIQALCAEKGIASRVDIWTLARSGKRQALCFVRTDPAVHEQQLAGMPGLTRIGNEMLFIVELPPEAPPAKRSADRDSRPAAVAHRDNR